MSAEDGARQRRGERGGTSRAAAHVPVGAITALAERLEAMARALRSIAAHRLGAPTLEAASPLVATTARLHGEPGGPPPANDDGDPRLTRALLAMRRQLGAAWTVAALARIAGMSRAAFARRFVASLGVPPLRHLATLRMREAERLLLASDDGLAAIAGQLGYASEFAFSRAFKRHTGVAPAIHRRRAREGAARREGSVAGMAGRHRAAA